MTAVQYINWNKWQFGYDWWLTFLVTINCLVIIMKDQIKEKKKEEFPWNLKI